MARLSRFIQLCAMLACLIQPAQAETRRVTPLDAGWRFSLTDVPAAKRADFDAGAWTKVDLPHTWNAEDGDDGGGGYFRGAGWYRRDLVLTPSQTRRRLFLQFDGATLAADVFVNGAKAGRHEGGYAAFRFEITGLVHAGANTLAVRVDSSPDTAIAPLGGDFTVYGGLWRGARLIAAEDLHIDLMDHGGPGVRVVADQITADQARVRVLTGVRNDGVTARADLRVDILDAKGRRVATDTASLEAPAGRTTPVAQTLSLPRPRLWNGRADPYRYKVVVTVLSDGRPRDMVSVPLGVREIGFDAKAGFLLNGRPYDLHGVNLHPSARPGRGVMVTDAEIKADIDQMAAMGVTGLRLAHFQHPALTYELADRAGLMVLTETPLNGVADDGPAFAANVRRQLIELIRQTQNHPSVVAWGIGNEVYRSDPATHALLAKVAAEARTQDPSRPTVYAHCCQDDLDPQATQGDLLGYNRYYGWYSGEFEDIAAWADRLHGRTPDRAIGVTEYGAGASVKHQQDPPVRPKPTDKWHPEQYQALYHEANWRALRARPWLWGKFVWVGFDFASDGRDEGDHPGINDKGLVTYDRKTTKDAYHWYKANWTTAPMAYITSRRFVERTTPTVTVKVYANTPTARLKVNGRDLGEVRVADHVALWPGVALRPGANRIAVTAGKARDTVTWRFSPPPARTASPAGG